MKTRRTLILSMLVFVLGLSLLMLGSARQANALTQAEWETVADSLHAYLSGSQYTAADDGEAGFINTPASFAAIIDSNADGLYCGVGDNMAGKPVLVDNLGGLATLIPGTEVRCNWTQPGVTFGCFHTDTLAAMKAKVDAHIAAGMSPDISVY